MLKPVTGLKSVYDTSAEEDLDISRVMGGLMGLICREAYDPVLALNFEVNKLGGTLLLTDMFRTWDHQVQAHHDFVTGKKKAYSPPPGRSFHQAGRSIDVDIKVLNETLRPDDAAKSGFDLYWEIANDLGFTGVVQNRLRPVPEATEAWHWDFLGVFGRLRQDVSYRTAAMVAIMDATGDNYEGYESERIQAYRLQGYLYHLGLYSSKIDGLWGEKSQGAMSEYLADPKMELFNLVLQHYGILDAGASAAGSFMRNY